MAEENYFFLPPENISGDSFYLSDEEGFHARKVLRRESGSIIWMLDGVGNAYRGRLDSVSSGQVGGTILERIPGYGEARKKVHLGVGILKKDKLEWIAEKATELGVNRISFLDMDNCVKKDFNLDRMRRIIRSAIKQCGRSVEPHIIGPVSLIEWIKEVNDSKGLKLVCHPGGSKYIDLEAVSTSRISVLIGPEGGFSANELYLANQSGFTSIDLGNRRLRAETAAIAACVQLLIT